MLVTWLNLGKKAFANNLCTLDRYERVLKLSIPCNIAPKMCLFWSAAESWRIRGHKLRRVGRVTLVLTRAICTQSLAIEYNTILQFYNSTIIRFSHNCARSVIYDRNGALKTFTIIIIIIRNTSLPKWGGGGVGGYHIVSPNLNLLRGRVHSPPPPWLMPMVSILYLISCV